jgi:hypothetical protein
MNASSHTGRCWSAPRARVESQGVSAKIVKSGEAWAAARAAGAGRWADRSVARLAAVGGDEMDALLKARLRDAPRCPIARYLAGCRSFDRGLPASGVRHMMVAHHADPGLESAALLVFAGLHACQDPSEPLLSVVLDTWEEFRRPEFDRCRRERHLLDAFAQPFPAAAEASSLARRLWRLPLRALRRQLAEALQLRSELTPPHLLAGC